MRRSLAGILSLHGDGVRHAAALTREAAGGAEARSTTIGPLTVAWSGPAPRPGDALCLVDGELDPPAGPQAGPDDEALALAAIRASGHSGLARLAGDFAIVVWDAPAGRGLLARDHMGARALFWAQRAQGLYFASELEPLLRMLPERPGPCHGALLQWLASEPIGGDATLYEGVHRLLPAHVLPLGGEPLEQRPYWTPRYQRPLAGDRPEIVDRLRLELRNLVGRSVSPRRAGGVLLSAGLDSTAIAATAVGCGNGAVRGYSAGFPGFPELDESEAVARFATELGLGGARVSAGGEGLLRGGLDHLVRWGVPPVGWADFWEQPLLARAVADGVERVVSGDGGDEVFGLRPHLLADLLRRGRLLEGRRLLHRIPGAADVTGASPLMRFAVDYGLRGAIPYRIHARAVATAGRGSTRPWLSAPSNERLRESVDRWAWKRLDGPLWWRSLTHLLTQRVESLGVLDHMRRRLEWAGLAGRHPFLNREAVELALRLPPELTYDPRLSRPLLRDALVGTLGDSLRLRVGKSRFDRMVIANLMGDLGAIRALVCAPGAEVGAYAQREGLRRLIDQGPGGHPVGPFVWAQEILRLVMIEVWLRQQAEPGFASALAARGTFSAARLHVGPIGSTNGASFLFPS